MIFHAVVLYKEKEFLNSCFNLSGISNMNNYRKSYIARTSASN